MPGYPAPIGGFKVVYEYANFLVKKNHLVSIVHSLTLKQTKMPKNPLKIIRRLGGKLISYINRNNIDWFSLDKRINMIYINEPIEKNVPDADIIIATAWQTADYINEYSKKKGKKYYIIMDFPPFMGSKNDIYRTWNYDMFKITISSWIYDLVCKITNSKKLVNNTIGVPNNIFKKINDLKNEPNMVLAMYSSGKYKGVDDLIKAFKIAKKKNPKLNFNLFGKEKKPRWIPDWITYNYKLKEKDLVVLMNMSGIFVSSSIIEGFGLPAAEASLCGCAIATTDSGGNRDYAIHNKTALVSKVNDPKTLASNILYLNSDEELRNRLINNGIKVIKALNWENAGKKFERYILK